MVLPLRSTYPALTCSWSRLARARVISTSGSTSSSDWPDGNVVVASWTAATCARSRDGITWSSLDSARNADSPTPATLPPAATLQTDGHRDGLLRVEQQRRQGRARSQLVSAAVPLAGVYGIAEVAEALDVAPHAAPRHAEPIGELLTAPHPPGLEQTEELQDPAGRFGHVESLPHS